MTTALGRRLGLGLAAVFAVFGVLELWTHRGESAGVLAFWGVTLLGAATLVTLGIVLPWPRRWMAQTWVITGLLLGLVPTAWTVVLPLLACGVLVACLYTPDEPA